MLTSEIAILFTVVVADNDVTMGGQALTTMRRCHWLQAFRYLHNIWQHLICCECPASLVQIFYFSFIAVVRAA